MSVEIYRKALKAGRKISRERLAAGESPYLPALERILEHADIKTQETLGVVEIPLERVIGTYASGRQPTFSNGFYPLMRRKANLPRNGSVCVSPIFWRVSTIPSRLTNTEDTTM